MPGRVALLVALAAGAVACGQPPSQLPSTGALVPPPATSPVAVTGPSGGCRLPVSGRGALPGQEVTGFLRFPGGAGVADPAGATVSGTGGDPRARTTAQPVLRGAPGASPSYDRAAGRWVPAPPAAVSPDGLRYAYAAGGGVHVVDVHAATDRVLAAGADREVLAFRAEGIYAVHRRTAADASDGLWLLDPATGAERQLRAPEAGVEWAAIGPGAAWASATVPGAAAEQVRRLDLGAGTVATWFERPGAGLRVIGADGDGHPLVEVADVRGSAIWLVPGPGLGRQVSASAAGGDDTPAYTASVTDATGTWISDDAGTLLHLVAASGLSRVAAPRLFASLQKVAGGCSR